VATPTQRRQWAERLTAAVETAPGSGQFVADGGLRVDWVEQQSQGRIAQARVHVQFDGEADLASALETYHADRRVAIRSTDSILFDGFPTRRRFEQRPTKSRTDTQLKRRLVLDFVHASIRAKIGESAQVFGRFVRDAAILDRIAAGDDRANRETVHATGLACVFNPNGTPNCSPEPILVNDRSGGSRAIHVFTDDLDETVIPWTFARALRYLLHFHSAAGDGPDTMDVLRRTDLIGPYGTADRAAYRQSDPLAFRLLDHAFDLSVEGTNLLRALRDVCRSAGIAFATDSTPIGAGITTRWRVWARESAPLRRLSVGDRPRTSFGSSVTQASDMPLREWLAARGGERASLDWDASAARTKSIVIGDVPHFAITAELWPGWRPEAGLDNVPMGSRSAAKSLALSDAEILAMGAAAATDDWFRQYHRQGSDFGGHRDVARLWVLNESAEYTTAVYGREGPHATYIPFDLSFFGGCVMRRRRPLVGVATAQDASPRVRVEVSFDNGETWHAQQGGFELLTNRAGLWFSFDNPSAISSPYIATDHLWNALVDQSMRVRVTAAIASDDRVTASAPGRFARTTLPSARIDYAPERLRSLTLAAPGTSPVVTYDDTSLAQSLATASSLANEGEAITGDVKLPWLDTLLRLGDRITGLDGVGLPIDAVRPPRAAHPHVTGLRHENLPDQYGTTVSFAFDDVAGRDGE